MTKKSKAKKETPAKKEKDKEVLYKIVQEHPTPTFIIVGALSKAGLLTQYLEEKSIYGIGDIEPSITLDELNKIIKEFIGE